MNIFAFSLSRWLRHVPSGDRRSANRNRFVAMTSNRPATSRFASICFRLNPPIALLLAFLQRTPVIRTLVGGAEFAAISPAGAVLRSTVATAAALGAMHSLAGATALDSTAPTPFAATVGTPVQIGFTVTNTINIASWKVTGTLPPGTILSAKEGGASLTGPGTLDATTPGMSNGYGGTTGGNSTTTPELTGTPTTAGTYTFNLQAYEFAGLTGLASNTFSYTVTVAAVVTTTMPSFSTQPASLTANMGDSISFTAAATGSPTPTYQWDKNGTAIPGATNSSLMISAVQTTDDGNYTVVATNSTGSTTSQIAALIVDVMPAFSTQPAAQSVNVGATVNLTAAATGTPTPTYQWQKNGTVISGATNATLMMSNVQTTDSGNYTVVATNSAGTATSQTAALTVTAAVTGTAPAFLRQPAAQTIASGTTAVLSADVSGTPNPTFQWNRNGVAITGATTSTLVVGNASASSAGNYTVTVTNSAGSSTSSVAALSVGNFAPSDVGHLTNLSIRTTAGTGAQTLTVGFAVGGAGTTGTKPLLIRALGPTLAAIGLQGTLADPVANIYLNNTTLVATNDNWGGDSTISSRATAVGAFPFASPTSLDAAFAMSPAIGSYSVQITDKLGGTGIALAEIYDATPGGTFTASTPRLVNVSARAQVGTGDGVLIAGFYVSGSSSRTVLIRAIGPTLGALGVPGTLADPMLQLFSGSTVIQQNDNWGGDPQLTTIGSSVGAFPLSDPNSKDSIMLVTLAPGLYSAEVSGVGNTTGVALIELYEVP